MSATETRRAAFRDEVGRRTGIDEATIRRVVDAFYARARVDPLLGPVFAARIGEDDWPAHLERMAAFWSSVVLMSGRYHGRPVPAHAELAVDAGHFDRWLALFRETTRETVSPEAAALFIDRAERIAVSLEAAIEAHQGRHLGRAGGFRMPAPETEPEARR